MSKLLSLQDICLFQAFNKKCGSDCSHTESYQSASSYPSDRTRNTKFVLHLRIMPRLIDLVTVSKQEARSSLVRESLDDLPIRRRTVS